MHRYHFARGALRAIWWGSFAGAFPFLLLTISTAVAILHSYGVDTFDDVTRALVLAIMPLLVVGAIVIPAFVLIGLPITLLLRRLLIKPDGRIGLIGAAAGVMLVIGYGLLINPDSFGIGFLTIPLGGFSGGTTGWLWAQTLAEAPGEGGVLHQEEQRDPGSSPG